MTDYAITLNEIVGMPDDAEIAVAPTGAIIGFRLADGRVLRPWLTFEIEEDDGQTTRDLDHDELVALDVEQGMDLTRHIVEA